METQSEDHVRKCLFDTIDEIERGMSKQVQDARLLLALAGVPVVITLAVLVLFVR